MQIFKDFFTSTAGKRAVWTLLNSVMALVVAFFAYMGTTNEFVAVAVLPLAQAAAQALTRYLNKKS